MGQNFDDYSDFQKIPGMPILLQHSVHLGIHRFCHFTAGYGEFHKDIKFKSSATLLYGMYL